MNAAAAAAVDFKNGFSTQFNVNVNGLMQPFSAADTADSLYTSAYSSYNNWASKVPSPLGAKTFPWSMNAALSTVNHHQSPAVNCFNAASSSMTSMSAAAGTAMLPGTMSSSLGGGPNAPPTAPSACPYGPAASPYTMYHHHRSIVFVSSFYISISAQSSPFMQRQHIYTSSWNKVCHTI